MGDKSRSVIAGAPRRNADCGSELNGSAVVLGWFMGWRGRKMAREKMSGTTRFRTREERFGFPGESMTLHVVDERTNPFEFGPSHRSNVLGLEDQNAAQMGD